MKTEDELKEFYLSVIHPDHEEKRCVVHIDTHYAMMSDKRSHLICKFDSMDGWSISRPGWGWYHPGDYINQFRTDLSDADKIALILRYS